MIFIPALIAMASLNAASFAKVTPPKPAPTEVQTEPSSAPESAADEKKPKSKGEILSPEKAEPKTDKSQNVRRFEKTTPASGKGDIKKEMAKKAKAKTKWTPRPRLKGETAHKKSN